VSIFESGVRDDRRTVGAGFVDAGAERARRPFDGIGRVPATRSFDNSRGTFSDVFLSVARLFFPVLLLVSLLAAAFIYGDKPAYWLGNVNVGGKPFETGLLSLPAMFFIVQLTNRRYGAGSAFFQLLGATLIAGGLAASMGDDLILLRGSEQPAARLAAAFGGGLFIAQLFSIFVFDRLRGPQWWKAPLFASLFGGIALCLVAFPAAYAGTDANWIQPMLAYMGVTSGAAILLLAPYWLLRSIVAPLPGFGGY
jgi:queuosine precursor transporter